MKALGAMLILLISGLLGLILARNLSWRQEILRELQVGLQFLETEIAYAATPLPEALSRVAEKMRGPASRLFFSAESRLRLSSGSTAAESWGDGVRALAEAAPLEEEDLTVLADFGQGLGSGDRMDQVKKLELARAQLRRLEEVAADNRARQAKVLQVLGFLGGLSLILLLYR